MINKFCVVDLGLRVVNIIAGEYNSNCFQTGDTARFNQDALSATYKAQLQQVGPRRHQCFVIELTVLFDDVR